MVRSQCYLYVKTAQDAAIWASLTFCIRLWTLKFADLLCSALKPVPSLHMYVLCQAAEGLAVRCHWHYVRGHEVVLT